MASEEEEMKNIIFNAYKLYFEHGPRSSKKVDFFHEEIKKIIETIFVEYQVKLECNVSSSNASERKKCDIVVLKEGAPHVIFPVKLIMTNYKQNKNNGWENLTGEVTHIKWSVPNVNIVPINIFIGKTPYLTASKIIKNFETITTDDIKNYSLLIDHKLCYDVINYIVDVDHACREGEEFTGLNSIIGFSDHTAYRNFKDILGGLV